MLTALWSYRFPLPIIAAVVFGSVLAGVKSCLFSETPKWRAGLYRGQSRTD